MDINFLKTKTILYVEDHEETQEKIFTFLKEIFKKVYLATNGEEGFETYENNKKEIDLIVSDINMPTTTGLQMLEKIRDKNYKVPVIFTTAYSDTNYLLDAIGLKVAAYIVKPFDIQELLEKVEEAVKESHSRKTIKNKKNELEDYVDLIDKVAVISKTDNRGNITFANDLFCEVSGYSKEELLGKNHNITRHPEMATSVFKELWENLRTGRAWSGKIKNLDKEGNTYIFNATIFPNYNSYGEIIEYVGIRFLITDEENEKREFKKKILNSIKESKEKEKKYIDKLIQYEKSTKDLKNYIKIRVNSISQEKEKMSKQHSQLLYYEDELKKIKDDLYATKKINNAKIFGLYNKLKELKEDNDKIKIENYELLQEVEIRKEQVEKLNEQVIEQSKVIVDLRDVIEHRESQLERLKY